MQRDKWSFEYSAIDLAKAAESKRGHHASRLKWWEEQKANVMTEVKETGIEVSESVADQYSNSTRGYGPQVMVRNDLQQKLTECHKKILEHDGKAKEYEGWRQTLTANSGKSFPLHADDYLYFFGK
jgi:hypothetical protein